MKYLLILFSLVTLISCNSKITKEGTIELKNGIDEPVKVHFTTVNPAAISEVYTKTQLDKILISASGFAKERCSFPLTYVPKEITDIVLSEDKKFLYFHLTLITKSAFGVPVEHKGVFKYSGEDLAGAEFE